MLKIKNSMMGDKNYYNEIYDKTQIVIGNTLFSGMDHVNLWKNKLNGKHKDIASFTVLLDGTVYNHYDPKFYSNFIKIGDYDKFIIPIVLENSGWLMKDMKYNNLIDWRGEIYEKDFETLEVVKWRGKNFWTPYSLKQMNSLVKLVGELSENFDIPLETLTHNIKIDDIHKKKGIYYRSNYSRNYLDVSPAFNFTKFKEKLDKYEKRK